MFEQIFTLSAFIWCSIGTGIGLFIEAGVECLFMFEGA